MLASIALEEISLAHIMNAEAEKIQEVLKTCKTDELFEVNDKVDKILMKVIKKEMLLQFKFENVLELIKCKKFRKHDD